MLQTQGSFTTSSTRIGSWKFYLFFYVDRRDTGGLAPACALPLQMFAAENRGNVPRDLDLREANQRLFRVSLVVMKHSKQKNHLGSFEAMASFLPTSRATDRKALQLCSQVRYSLEYAINSVLNGEYGLTVLEVVPAPNTSHLLVLVQSLEDLSFEESIRVEQLLKDQTSLLRTAVSESIHRKKTPGLSFQIVPRQPKDS